MSQIKANASVTNASATVTSVTGTDWSTVAAGNIFSVVGSGVPYYVGSTVAPAVGNGFLWQIVLTGVYVGTTNAAAATIVTKDFTPRKGLPLLNAGDNETVTLFNRLAAILDADAPGVIDGSSPAAGQIGEIISATLVSGSAVSLTNGVSANVTSVSLTKGDWDVSGLVVFHPGATSASTGNFGGSSVTSATLGPLGSTFANPYALATTGNDPSTGIPTVQYNFSATTTVYLVALCNFTVSTMTTYGKIRARRMR